MDSKEKTTKDVSLDIVEELREKKGSCACLVSIHGCHFGKKFDLNKDEIVIGRAEDADISLDIEHVSRKHAVIIKEGSSYVLKDNDSTNGTFVNTQKIKEVTLLEQDIILIGNTLFKFLSGENLEQIYHKELYRLATIDCLLNIYNKKYFLEKIEQELSRSQRYRRDLSLVMFDIDHFKQINDTHGHLAGDYILQKLAKTVKSHLRKDDTFARYGGEEFAIILPETNVLHAAITCEKIRTLIEDVHFVYQTEKIPVTISLGLTSYKPGRQLESYFDLIEKADHALYQAKNTGRNKVVCFDRI